MCQRHSSPIRHLYHSLPNPKTHPKGAQACHSLFLSFTLWECILPRLAMGGQRGLHYPLPQVKYSRGLSFRKARCSHKEILGGKAYAQCLHLKPQECPPYVPGSHRRQWRSSVSSERHSVSSPAALCAPRRSKSLGLLWVIGKCFVFPVSR